jgi:hypothetical protein
MWTLRIRFYNDPSTGAPHILNHQVAEDEVADVLEEPGEDRAGREGSRIALGQTASGVTCGLSMCQTRSLTAFS